MEEDLIWLSKREVAGLPMSRQPFRRGFVGCGSTSGGLVSGVWTGIRQMPKNDPQTLRASSNHLPLP